MTKHGNTNGNSSNGVNPRTYFSALEDTFEAVPVRFAHFVPAGSSVTVVGKFRRQEVTVQRDSWLLDGETILSGQKLVDNLDGMDIIPLSDVRKQWLREGVECLPIRKGEAYGDNLKRKVIAPRDGRIIRVSASELPKIKAASNGSNGVSGPGSKRSRSVEMFSALVIKMLKAAGAKFVDGYVFLSEEQFLLYFNSETPSGLALVRNGEPFRAAVLKEDVTFAFVHEGDFPVKAGTLVHENRNDVDGISTGLMLSFLRRNAPLA